MKQVLVISVFIFLLVGCAGPYAHWDQIEIVLTRRRLQTYPGQILFIRANGFMRIMKVLPTYFICWMSTITCGRTNAGFHIMVY